MDRDLGDLTQEQDEFIKKAFNSNEQMLKLVNKLLVMNHADDTTILFHIKPIDFMELLDGTLTEFSDEAQKKKIKIILNKPDADLPNINCDKEMIHVVLQNLVENAIKYNNPDGKITIEVKNNPEEKSFSFSIHDEGIGISSRDKDKIFNKLFRAPNAIEKEKTGSGLGLFTTKNIIERHNGKIWFDSSDDNGTTFYFKLPTL
jgi:signal transduction histidine kinase